MKQPQKQPETIHQNHGKTHEGKLFTNSRGMGFVILDIGSENEERIDIPDEDSLNTGLHGDTVLVAIHPTKEGEPRTGEVEKIVTRAKTQFVGTIDRNGRFAFLIPDSKKSYKDFFLPLDSLNGAEDNEKVLIEFVKWNNPHQNPVGKVLRVNGKKGEHETEMRATALERGFDITFPDAVSEEAGTIEREIHDEEIGQRRDFREITTFTIDPDNAKDFDDALSYHVLENGDREIGIHIADVTHYVKPGMRIEDEAVNRATSVYLVDRTIPMLPEVLSNDMCSLRPNEDRLAYSAVFTFGKNSWDKNGHYEITKEWYGRTIIHSDRRFTYQEAEDILKAGDGEFIAELQALQALSRILRKERFDKGAIRFETDEIKIELDEYCKPIEINKKEHLETHELIEEFMLLANRKVAEFVTKKNEREKNGQPFVYRIHAEPDRDRMEDFIAFLRPLGYTLEFKKGGILSTDLNRLLEKSSETPEENIIHTAAIRTMAKAIYSTKNIGHYGLAFEYYTHFTSPIRRYPDMLVHRLLDTYLKDEKISKKDASRLNELVLHSSEREKDAADAERDSRKYKQVEYMQTRIGEKFKGVVSGLSKGGIFVMEEETLAEGLIRFRELHDDFYELDEKNYRLVGQNTKKAYSLGDVIDIKVIKTSLELRQIDYGLA